MLFILRQLRRLELRKRSGQYFIYALGEVVLIVIGILIALQIQNWNEERKQAEVVKLALEDIRVDLLKEADRVGLHLDYLSRRRLAVEALKQHFAGNPIAESEVARHFGKLTSFPNYRPVRISYDSFKDSKLPLNNRTLKLKLTDYYEFQQGYVDDTSQNYEWFYKNIYLSFQGKHMRVAKLNEVAIPRDLSDPQLASDFEVTTFHFDTLIGNCITRMTRQLEISQEIIELIDNELTQR